MCFTDEEEEEEEEEVEPAIEQENEEMFDTVIQNAMRSRFFNADHSLVNEIK